MKILFAHNFYQQPGGEDVVFKQECQMLERQGHNVIAYRRSNFEIEGYPGLRRLDLARKAVWAPDSKREFAALLRHEKPDVVHVHNTFVVVSPSIFSACSEAGIPVVMTLHNYRLYCPSATFFRDGHICEECVEHGPWRAVGYGCYRGSRAATATVALMLSVHRQRQTWTREVDGYIALTQFAKSRFLSAGLPSEKIAVKPNFVYPDPGMAESAPRDYAVFAGRLSPEKRVNTMLTAWSRMRSPIPLKIIGSGPQAVELEREAQKLGLNTVTFLGQRSREDTLAVIRSARFLIFSSEWYENFPVTIAEAFACGVPVLCSRLGAMREIVEDGRTGLHFAPGDPDDLAETVQRAWRDPERVCAMGREARREFESKYTIEQNYPMLMDIYQQVIARKSTSQLKAAG
jgi:glycosyltransferase involved in cell wall biosynthesis